MKMSIDISKKGFVVGLVALLVLVAVFFAGYKYIAKPQLLQSESEQQVEIDSTNPDDQVQSDNDMAEDQELQPVEVTQQ